MLETLATEIQTAASFSIWWHVGSNRLRPMPWCWVARNRATACCWHAFQQTRWYAQVLGGTCGSWLGWATLFISMFNLLGNGTAQIVAGAANTYSINPILTKRWPTVLA